MAVLEYADALRTFEIISTETIVLASNSFERLARNVNEFNQAIPIATLVLTEGPSGQFDYRVVTRAGLVAQYTVFVSPVLPLRFHFTTENTIWFPVDLLRNTDLRRAVFDAVAKFGITNITLTYF